MARASQPIGGGFHDPAPRQHLKAFHLFGTGDNFQCRTKVVADKIDQVFVAASSPNQLQATPAIMDILLDVLKQALQNQFPAASCRLAQWTKTSSGKPNVSITICRLRPGVCLYTSAPRASPPSEVFTPWLSRMAAVGYGWRPYSWRIYRTYTG